MYICIYDLNINVCVEDEIHILLKCPLYDDVRSNLLSDIHDTGMSLQKQFIQILSCPEQQAALAKCIFRIVERRNIFKKWDL